MNDKRVRASCVPRSQSYFTRQNQAINKCKPPLLSALAVTSSADAVSRRSAGMRCGCATCRRFALSWPRPHWCVFAKRPCLR